MGFLDAWDDFRWAIEDKVDEAKWAVEDAIDDIRYGSTESYNSSYSDDSGAEAAKKELEEKKKLAAAKMKAKAFLSNQFAGEDGIAEMDQQKSITAILQQIEKYGKRQPTEIRELTIKRSKPRARVKKLDSAIFELEELRK